MLKPKTIDIADSNLALFGSETEKNVKKAAAATEKQWVGAGKEAGMQIWRVEKFKIVPWPKESYGSFHTGDAYICLNTYKKKGDTDALAWDVHFWIGSEATQDEAGTAAYKTVELDTLLDDAPVQYRETQGHESDLFLSYFPKGIVYLAGGIESGFRHVEATKYRARLLQVKGARDNVFATEVPCEAGSLNSGDCFIVDGGLQIYVWKGSKASAEEMILAAQIANALRDERAGKPEVVRLDESEKEESTFWKMLGVDEEPKSIKSAEEGGDDTAVRSAKVLFRLTDDPGAVTSKGEGDAASAPPPTSKKRVILKAAEDFDAVRVAEKLRNALKKFFGKDYKAIHEVFTSHSKAQLHEVDRQYGIKYKRDLTEDLKKKCGGDLGRLFHSLTTKTDEHDAQLLHDALHRALKADRGMVAEVMCARTTNESIKALVETYERMFSFKLGEHVMANAGGFFQSDLVKFLGALLEARRADGDVDQDAAALWKAGEGKFLGTDEAVFIDIFAHRTMAHLAAVFEKYRWLPENTRGHSIIDAIRAEEGNSQYARCLLFVAQLAAGDPSDYYAERLYRSMRGLGTDDTALVHVIVTAMGQGQLIERIKESFYGKYGKTLTSWIRDDTSGNYRDLLLEFIGEEAPDQGYTVTPGGGVSNVKMTFQQVAKDKVTRDMFKTEDVFIFNSGFEVYVWIGKGASKAERKLGLYYAQEYLKMYDLPPYTPIVRCFEGGENETFNTQLDA